MSDLLRNGVINESSEQSINERVVRIGVDLDEVLVQFIPAITKYYNTQFEASLSLDSYDGRDWSEIWQIEREGVNKVLSDFSKTGEFEKFEPIPGAKEVLEDLKKTGRFEFYLITARSQDQSQKTLQWINTHFCDIFNNVVFANSHGQNSSLPKKEKVEICKELKCSVMIDDLYSHLEKCIPFGIRGILFNFNGGYNWCNAYISNNKNNNLNHATSWKEIGSILINL